MTPAQTYRKLANELRVQAAEEAEWSIKHELGVLARGYARRAEQLDRKYEPSQEHARRAAGRAFEPGEACA